MNRRVSVGLLLLLLSLAGCGGAQSPPGVATAVSGGAVAPSPTPSLSEAQKAINYVKCIREHGVQIGDPQPNGKGGLSIPGTEGGPPKDAPGFDAYINKVTAAQHACGPLAPPGSVPDAPLTDEDFAEGRAFAKCMRSHGVDWPDPVNGQPGPPQPRVRDPQTQAVIDECTEQGRRIRASQAASRGPG